EIDPPHGVVDVEGRGASVDLQALDVVAPTEAAYSPAGVSGKEHGALAAGAIQVLVELQPDESQAVGRVVAVPDRDRAADTLLRRVQRRGNRVVGALLPVLGTRGSRPGAKHV